MARAETTQITRASTLDAPSPPQAGHNGDPDGVAEGHVVTTSERNLAAEHWLLSAARDIGRARADWERDGLTYLRCGGVFTAVQIPGVIVHSAAQTSEPGAVDAFLLGALKGGPVIASAGLTRYSVLVPPSAARTWRDPGTQCLPAGTELGVPPLTVTGYRPGAWYWAVPPRSAGELCSAGLTDQLARYGQSHWAKWRR